MTKQAMEWLSRIGAAWRVLTASEVVRARVAAADPRNRAATLGLDLRDRDAELVRVREEYERLRRQAGQEAAAAADAGFEVLARRLAPLLSQLATMEALAAGGRSLRAEDALRLFGKVERQLGEAGLVRIGAVGEQTAFDTRWHQRMSGADVRDGDAVTVRFIGYRLGEAVLLKAMVSRGGAAPEADEGASAAASQP